MMISKFKQPYLQICTQSLSLPTLGLPGTVKVAYTRAFQILVLAFLGTPYFLLFIMSTLFRSFQKLCQSFPYFKNPFNMVSLLARHTVRFLWPVEQKVGATVLELNVLCLTSI